MTPQDVERDLGVDVALRWGTGYDTELRSFVNVIATPKGGTHVAGFEQAVTKTFNEVLEVLAHPEGHRGRRHQGRRARGPDGRRHGPAGRAAVRGPDQGGARHPGGPQDRHQGRRRRAEEVPDLDQARREGAGQAGPGEGRERVPHPDRGPHRTGRPSAARTRWSRARCRPSWPTAAPTTSSAPSSSSSRATRRSARPSSPGTREFQALLPIRGKILNVQKASVGDMLKNTECASIIQVVGAGSGRTFDIDAAPLRPDHLHGRRGLRRRAHPLPARDAVLQVHAGPDHRGPGLHRRPAAAPHRAVQPEEGHGQVRLHLLRRRAAAEARRAQQEERALEGPDPALQGPR